VKSCDFNGDCYELAEAMKLNTQTATLFGLVLTAIVVSGCGKKAPIAEQATAGPDKAWWKQETATTWTGFGDPAHRKWLDFVRQLGTTACDRGVFYPHKDAPGRQAAAADYYHRQGLQLTSFLSIDRWQPDQQSVTELIARMRRQLDDGCDGVHLDMLFCVADPKKNVEQSDVAVRAVAQMRDAAHDHPRKSQVMFAGNTWKLDSTFSLKVASLCDVAWIESWGHDDLELVRIARVARSLGGYGKPTWYHWQPHDNEQARVEKLTNLPRALYSSCLMEGAVFLCNYQYPVPLVRQDEQGQKVTDWKMFPINAGWQQSVLRKPKFGGPIRTALRNQRSTDV